MEITLTAFATTVTAADGQKFHPAIQTPGSNPCYFELVTFATEQEAYEHASLALHDAYDAANQISRQWNVVKL